MSEQQSSYHNSGVRVGEWWEADAWRTKTTDAASGSGGDPRQQVSAASGARAFGRRAACSTAEILARTDGRDTASITSWGHEGRWEEGPLPSSRVSRKAMIEPPSTTVMESTLRGDGLGHCEQQEPILSSTGGHALPPRSACNERAPTKVYRPWAHDDDPPDPSERQPLFDSISGYRSRK